MLRTMCPISGQFSVLTHLSDMLFDLPTCNHVYPEKYWKFYIQREIFTVAYFGHRIFSPNIKYFERSTYYLEHSTY